jgi:CBS domain-containing protein
MAHTSFARGADARSGVATSLKNTVEETAPGPDVRLNQKGQDDMTTIAAILKHKGHAITTVEPTAHISAVARTLTDHHIGAVLVMDRAEQMLGIVSERDIVISLAEHGNRTMDMTAAQLMTSEVHVVHPETSVNEAMQTMTAGHFRHLPVIDRGRLVGLISIGDVVKARIVDADTAVDSLTAYVAGSV